MADASWRRTNAIVAVASSGILLLVLVLLVVRPGTSVGKSPSVLATYNAAMNAATVVALTVGYGLIRRGHRDAHRRAMTVALIASIAFLIGYVAHHLNVGSVRYTGSLRTLYFSLLVPHIALAAAEVPLVLLTVAHAWAGRFEKHRRMARVALPVWLFVSASGVAVYFLLYWT